MAKSADAFRSIGEVAKLVGVAPHVLRYWETQFSLLKPVKRRDGRRYYRPDDVRLAAGLCEVLREEGLTIRGARKMLARDRGQDVRDRGAIRLGEALSAQQPAGPAATVDEMPAASEAPPEAAPAPTASAPKSRLRRRPAPPVETLPLFPEWPDGATDQADVLIEEMASDAAPAAVSAPAPAPVPEPEPVPAGGMLSSDEPASPPASLLPAADPGHSDWLRRLTALSAALAARRADAAPDSALRAAAADLRAAIDAHY